MHYPSLQSQQKYLQHQNQNFYNSWTLQHRSPPEFITPTHYLNVLEEEIEEGQSSHGAASSTSPLIMIPSNLHPTDNKNYGGHRFLPNGDILLPQNRFRSLNRPKLNIQTNNNNFGGPPKSHNHNHKRFSRSEWDLRHPGIDGIQIPPNTNLAYTSSSGQSPATSVVESAAGNSADENQSEQFIPLTNIGGFFRSHRHHGHYFSNAELFAQPFLGFNYLKYAKASDFEQNNTNAPHIRITDLFYELDSRTTFDRAMFRSNTPLPIIRGMSFELFGGDTLCLMYSSYLEIECLLRILTNFDLPRGKITGKFEINGHSLKPQQFAERVAYVSTDSLPKWLTVLEYLDYYSQLQKPSTNAVPRRRMITQLIHGLALGPLKYRLCKDLSFTEQQRLKIAAKMLLDTDILIIDNILIEIDLYDYAFIIDFVRDWAQRFSRIVIIASIPSSLELLTMFRKTAIMSSGRLMYFGESSQMCEYFQSIGFPTPSFKNPCDYYVDLVTLDYLTSESAMESSTRIRTLGDIWLQKQPELISTQSSIISPKIQKPSIFSQFFLVYFRFWTLFFNRPWPRCLGEICITVILSLMLGCIFYDLPRSRRSGIDDREGFLCSILCFIPFILAIISLDRIFEDRKILCHDFKLKLYPTWIYLIAKIIFDLPFAIFSGACLASPAYFLVHLNPIIEDNFLVFLTFLIPIILNLLITRYFAWIFAFLINSKLVAYTVILTFFSVILMFSGFIIHESDQWKPFGIINLQNFIPQNYLSKEILQLIYLNGNQSSLYQSINEIFGISQKRQLPDFTIDCLKRSITAPKLTAPVLIVQQCLKTSGNQIFAFSSFIQSFFDWFNIGLCFLTIFICLLFVTIVFRPKSLKSNSTLLH
uniref:ABC transporter domain-containing protein n=1 Tax=Panagrolaimus sp. PS1159 TaxID=55785 RepID=A0AC35G5I2_9BILA